MTPLYPRNIPLYYLTPIEHLPHIQKHGLLSRNRARQLNLISQDIADQDVISRRAMKNPYGRNLLNYVPLYFQPKNPMLSRRRANQDQIAIIQLNHLLTEDADLLFTDGNAASAQTLWFTELHDLSKLDWNCLHADRWNEFPDGRRKRMAEVLVPQFIPFDRIDRIIVRTENVKAQIQNLLPQTNLPIHVDIRWYF